MEKIRKPRGTMDIMEPDVAVWQFIEEKAVKTADKFGFTEIRTPTFEELSLFQRGVGEGTDVVQKEMYTFTDKEDRVFALRPEGTAGVVRAVIENGKCSDTLPLKYFYITNCFRYEKPQAGRSREFVQFGTEVLGSADAGADYTIISLAAQLLKDLGITGVVLHVNSIGCPECRPKYREALTGYLNKNIDRLCDTCKNPECHEVAKEAPRTIDYLCEDCQSHMDKLCKMLDEGGIPYVIDSRIVRGLDYYTKTVFEFIAEGIGAQSTVCGGGRYDGLVKELGGPAMAACGFGMGITRLILAMEACGVKFPERKVPKLYIASMGEAAQIKAQSIVTKLRDKGVYAECDITCRSLKAQMKYADKIGAEKVLILGDSELESGVAPLRDMTGNIGETGQTDVEISKIYEMF